MVRDEALRRSTVESAHQVDHGEVSDVVGIAHSRRPDLPNLVDLMLKNPTVQGVTSDVLGHDQLDVSLYPINSAG